MSFYKTIPVWFSLTKQNITKLSGVFLTSYQNTRQNYLGNARANLGQIPNASGQSSSIPEGIWSIRVRFSKSRVNQSQTQNAQGSKVSNSKQETLGARRHNNRRDICYLVDLLATSFLPPFTLAPIPVSQLLLSHLPISAPPLHFHPSLSNPFTFPLLFPQMNWVMKSASRQLWSVLSLSL